MEDTFRPFAATSRGISELNPFGILISRGTVSQQSMGLHSFENNGKSSMYPHTVSVASSFFISFNCKVSN